MKRGKSYTEKKVKSSEDEYKFGEDEFENLTLNSTRSEKNVAS